MIRTLRRKHRKTFGSCLACTPGSPLVIQLTKRNDNIRIYARPICLSHVQTNEAILTALSKISPFTAFYMLVSTTVFVYNLAFAFAGGAIGTFCVANRLFCRLRAPRPNRRGNKQQGKGHGNSEHPERTWCSCSHWSIIFNLRVMTDLCLDNANQLRLSREKKPDKTLPIQALQYDTCNQSESISGQKSGVMVNVREQCRCRCCKQFVPAADWRIVTCDWLCFSRRKVTSTHFPQP